LNQQNINILGISSDSSRRYDTLRYLPRDLGFVPRLLVPLRPPGAPGAPLPDLDLGAPVRLPGAGFPGLPKGDAPAPFFLRSPVLAEVPGVPDFTTKGFLGVARLGFAGVSGSEEESFVTSYR